MCGHKLYSSDLAGYLIHSVPSLFFRPECTLQHHEFCLQARVLLWIMSYTSIYQVDMSRIDYK